MTHFNKLKSQERFNGFTLVEIIVVVVILGIAALIAVPMFSGAADMQVRSAANRVAADLDYAKGLAVTHQKNYSVVFYPASESYDIRETVADTIVKNPVRPDDTGDTWRARVDESVERLGFAPDVLNFHFLSWDRFKEKCKPKNGLLKVARKAQDEGLFTHLALSSHDSPAGMKKLIDTGEFVSIILQYNLLDRVNEEVIEQANKKGLGVVVMGPVGGGR